MENKDFDVEKKIKGKVTQERRREINRMIDKHLADASIDEAKVLRMRFGGASSDNTMDDVKKYMGLSRERIREIENKARAKLQAAGRLAPSDADGNK